MSASVHIVVVNWRQRGATLDCLAALGRMTDRDWALVLVDNGCRDFSQAELDRLAPGARYLASPTNLGFAGGANLGWRAARQRGASWVWFLNNDAMPEAGALSALRAAAAGPPPADLVGAKILQRQAPDRLDSVGVEIDLGSGRLRLIGHDEIDRGQYDGLSDPLAVTGCALFASMAALDALDGFDEHYFAYLEDVDLCLRARELGFRVALAPRARVLHDRLPAHRGRQSPASLYYSTRNHLRLLQRHGRGAPWLRTLQEARVAAWSAAYALARGGGGRLARLRAARRGIADYRRHVTGPDPAGE
jgi:hypothetical protein